MMRPASQARGDGAYLGEGATRLSIRQALPILRRHPRQALSILGAWIGGKRLRARQRHAALVGIDHQLALPPSAIATKGRADEGDEAIVIVGGERLVPGAMKRLRQAFAANPEIQALYGDGLVQNRPGGPVHPRLPPAFDPDLILAVDYLGTLALRRGALPEPMSAHPVEAALRVVEAYGAGAIGHLPGTLTVRSGDDPVPEGAVAARLAAVRGHLDRTGATDTTVWPGGDGVLAVIHPLPETPLVTIIVPTRDRLDLLRPCLQSLRAKTAWPSLDIVVIDNGSREEETLAYLRAFEGDGRGRVVRYPGPFNFAAMNNEAVRHAEGRLLVFLNNDVEAFRPDWPVAMARHALRPGVGAVGAKLLDGEGRIQHGGIVLGTGGLVTHSHRHFPGDAPGYLSKLRAAHRVSAVTAACLMVETSKFREVGGFDAERFAVDFNDVDLCLRLNAAGYRTMVAPAAVLHHREAASRRWTPEAAERHAREIAALKERWGPLLVQDPHYHPGFDVGLSTHARLAQRAPADQSIRRPA